MSWLNTIKDHLVEAEQDPQPTPAPPPMPYTPPAVSTTSSLHIGVLKQQDTPVAAQIPTDGFLAKLRSKLSGDVIDKLNATLGSLSAIPEAGMRLNAAVSVLQSTMGIEVAQLNDAYNARVNTLELQSGQFLTALQAQTTAEVTARETSIKHIGEEIESKSREIQDLVAQRETLNSELIAAKTKLAGAQAGFEGAVATLKQEISEQLNQLRTVKQ